MEPGQPARSDRSSACSEISRSIRVTEMNKKEALEISNYPHKYPTTTIAEATGYLEGIDKARILVRFITDWGSLIGGEFEEDAIRHLEEWEKLK